MCAKCEIREMLVLNTIDTFDGRTLNVLFRVQSYIEGGLDKDLIDRDNGENIARKRRNLGINAGCITRLNKKLRSARHKSLNVCLQAC